MSSKFHRSFYFVRHGETDWNRDYLYQGQNDVPLNEMGVLQAQERANSSFSGITEVFTSPLLRAKSTAEIIRERHPHIEKIVEVPELMECKSEESARYVLGLKNVEKMPSFEKVVGNKESPQEFIDRIKNGLELVLRAASSDRPLIVAHGGVCVAICKVLGIGFFRTPNCCMVSFEFNGDGYSARIID